MNDSDIVCLASEDDIVCLATTPNRGLGEFWRNTLQAAGIECKLQEHIGFWINKVPCLQADLWVHRVNVRRACEILDHNLSGNKPPLQHKGQEVVH